MVYLNRIYTKTGDAGETSLGDGTRVSKTHRRIRAYGGVDELNSVIGVALTAEMPEEIAGWLKHIQNDLFDLGADLCIPEPPQQSSHPAQRDEPSEETSGHAPRDEPLRVTEVQVATLEHWIDAANARLQPLSSFVLPGGTPAAAHLHYARTVCRRVEIAVLELAREEPVNARVVIYLNRLSDLLFVLARIANHDGADDVLWVPGQHRQANN